MRMVATVLGTSEPRTLAAFYKRLLGWTVVTDELDWVTLRPPSGGIGLSFQFEANYVPPIWPEVPGKQQMMAHVDIAVDDLDAAVAMACDAGATVADHQPQDDVWVMLDPAGHPFCLFVGPV